MNLQEKIDSVFSRILETNKELGKHEYALTALVKGLKVKVTSDTFNGQPDGTSKTLLKDKIVEIVEAREWGGEILFYIEGCDAPMSINEFEFLDN